MSNEVLNIHFPILERFQTIRIKQLLAHAYLFVGPTEIGKSETALAIAKAFNRANPDNGKPCEACRNCRRINDGIHPDVHLLTLAEDAAAIKIEQVRELLAQTRLRPFEAEIKIFIVKDAERMTIEGCNALLKTLEEPTKSSLLLLTSSVPEKLLPTIRSRCQQIHFPTQSNEAILQYLEGEYVETFSHAHFLAFFADGCLKKARRLMEEDFFTAKNAYLDDFLYNRDTDKFIKNIAADKESAADLLKILMSWVRDAILIKSGVEDKRLIHLDRKNDLDNFQIKFTFNELNALYQQVVQTQKLLADNLNIRMALMILKEKIT